MEKSPLEETDRISRRQKVAEFIRDLADVFDNPALLFRKSKPKVEVNNDGDSSGS